MKSKSFIGSLVAHALAMHANAITSFDPAIGTAGTDVTIIGSGFANATGATVNGVPAPFLIVSDTSCVVSVPSTATTGAITIADPDGNHVSATPFTVALRAPAIPAQETTRGRDALNTLLLAAAAKLRSDNVGVAQAFARDLLVSQVKNGDFPEASPLLAPTSTSTDAQRAAYFARLLPIAPVAVNLRRMTAAGTGFYALYDDGVNVFESVLAPAGSSSLTGFVVVVQNQLQEI